MRRKQRHDLRDVFLQAAHEMPEHRRVGIPHVGEQVFARLVDKRNMQMHRAARLAVDRLRHEGGMDALLRRGLARDALEQHHLVGEIERIAVERLTSSCAVPVSWLSVSTAMPAIAQCS